MTRPCSPTHTPPVVELRGGEPSLPSRIDRAERHSGGNFRCVFASGSPTFFLASREKTLKDNIIVLNRVKTDKICTFGLNSALGFLVFPG